MPSFWREVGNPRKWFVVVIFFHHPVQLFLQASSQFNLFLGVDFAQMGCNQNASLLYGRINSEQPGGYADVNVEHTSCPFLALTFVPLLRGITCPKRHFISSLAEENPAMFNLGVP